MLLGLQGNLGCKKSAARGSVGRCFPNLRKPRAKAADARSVGLRKRPKVVGARFLKFKSTHESGRSIFLEIRPVRVDVHVLFCLL